MKLNKEDLLLYGVTDSKYLKGRKMSELVEEAILGGVTMIQLREKEMTHEAFMMLNCVKKLMQMGSILGKMI